MKTFGAKVSTGILLMLAFSNVFGSVISTRWEGLVSNVASALQSYSSRHDGSLPDDVNSLFTGIEGEILKEELGGNISTKIIYFKNNAPPLDGSDGAKLIGMIAFPINEDRRKAEGRYIIYRKKDGTISSQWAGETIVQSSVAKANIEVPEAPTYQERPLKPLDPDYAARLVEDAVKQYGMSAREATDKVNKHVVAVMNGQAKAAKTWAEVVTNQPPATPRTTTPLETTMPQSTPRPAASALPKATVETKSPTSFPIVPVAILALAIIGVIVVLLRRKSP